MTNATAGLRCVAHFAPFLVIPQISVLLENGFNVVPIMSQTAFSIDTRFGKTNDFIKQLNPMQ